MKNPKVQKLVTAGIIAALYATLCLAVPPLTASEFRIAEAMTILPVFTTAAIPGLAVGCLIANLLTALMGANPAGIWDIVFGTLATLVAATLTHLLRKVTFRPKWPPVLATLPPVLVNALVIPIGITFAQLGHWEWGVFWGWAWVVGISQAVTCIGGGLIIWGVLRQPSLRERMF